MYMYIYIYVHGRSEDSSEGAVLSLGSEKEPWFRELPLLYVSRKYLILEGSLSWAQEGKSTNPQPQTATAGAPTFWCPESKAVEYVVCEAVRLKFRVSDSTGVALGSQSYTTAYPIVIMSGPYLNLPNPTFL